jgi:hypothetical protein
MVNSVLAIDQYSIISRHTRLPRRTVLRRAQIIALLCIRARGATHLAALVYSSGTVCCGSHGRASTKLVVNQLVMSIGASMCDHRVVGDTGPDG